MFRWHPPGSRSGSGLLRLDGLDPRLTKQLPAVNWPELYGLAERNDGDVPARFFEHPHINTGKFFVAG